LGWQKVNKVEPKHIHACKANLLHKRLHMHIRQWKPNPKSSLHYPPQNNTTAVAKSGKTNINNSVLSREGNRNIWLTKQEKWQYMQNDNNNYLKFTTHGSTAVDAFRDIIFGRPTT